MNEAFIRFASARLRTPTYLWKISRDLLFARYRLTQRNPMPNRREFVEGSVLAAGLAFAAASGVRAQGKTRYVDQLTDSSGKYAAAPLPYGYDALEPAIDARTVELHYNNHHKPAAAAANRAEDELAKARESEQFPLVKHYEKELAYQLSSHILHSIYWTNLG